MTTTQATDLTALLGDESARHLVVSVSASSRLALARGWLAARRRDDAIVLSPSWRAGQELVRGVVQGQGGVLGWRPLTLEQLTLELALPALCSSGRTALSGLALEALAVRATYAALEAGELEHLVPIARLPGFPRALHRTLFELRMDQGAVDALARDPNQRSDLAKLHRRYLGLLHAGNLADRAVLLELATAALERGANTVAGRPLLLLDLWPNHAREDRFLSALVARAGPVLGTAPGEASPRSCSARLERAFGCAALELDRHSAGPGARLTRLARVQRFVFRAEVEEGALAAGADRSLEFFSAAGEGKECVEIARRLRDTAAQGMPFDRMAVLLRSPSAYLPLLEDALRRARVPLYASRGTSRPDPAGRAFLALLACAVEGLSAARFAEYLSLGQVPVLDRGGEPPLRPVPWVEPADEQLVLVSLVPVDDGSPASAPAEEPTLEVAPEEAGGEEPSWAGNLSAPQRWEELLVEAAVVGGADRWRRRLRGLRAELERQRTQVQEEDGRSAALEQRLGELRHLERFALPLIDTLAGLPRTASWGTWLDHLQALASRALRRPHSVLGLLADLRPMAVVAGVGLEQVQLVLAERLTELRVEPPARRHGRVFVGTIAEAIGREFAVVCVPGLAEGLFPRPRPEDPLLLDEQRAALSPALVRQDERLLEERRLLHLAVGAATERLVLSYPRVDTDRGRQRVPSFYALDLLRAAEGRLPELQALLESAAASATLGPGWPAPHDPAQAIDDAEFDLALLQPLLEGAGPPAARVGRARFLLRANPHLARALRTRWARYHSRFSPSDGLVEPGSAASAVLAHHRLHARSYSATALQNYAACPYRFFLHTIHRLRPRDELAGLEQIDPLTRGSLFHAIQFDLFRRLSECGLQPVRESNLDAALDVLDQVVDAAALRYAEELAPAIPRIFASEVELLRTDLRGWLHETATADWQWQPLHAELAFGLPAGAERDASSRAQPVLLPGGGSLVGSIDLVEVHAGGQRLRVTDYKTGRVPRDENSRELRPGMVVGGGRFLQPALYALAAEAMLAEPPLERAVVAGRLSYATQAGRYQVLEVEWNEPARVALHRVLGQIDAAVEQGFLPAAPARGQCRFCDYRLVCGPNEEVRVAKKDARALEALLELRRSR